MARIAAAWAELMARLGYARYGAQGGDWGTSVVGGLGRQDAEHVAGIHLMPLLAAPFGEPTAREQAALAAASAPPRTPATPAAVHAAADARLRPRRLARGAVRLDRREVPRLDRRARLTHDELLDNVMLYWLPGTGASSARLYWELAVRDLFTRPAPTRRPDRLLGLPARDLRALPPLGRAPLHRRPLLNELPRGGHFAAFEQPELFVDELRAFAPGR